MLVSAFALMMFTLARLSSGGGDEDGRKEGNTVEEWSPERLLKSSKEALTVTRKEYLKKDWCKTEPLVQRIRENGCLPKTIINRFCYGQCNSFFVPKSPGRKDDAFNSCGACRPKKASWVTVNLHCPSRPQSTKRKKVYRIKQCRCLGLD